MKQNLNDVRYNNKTIGKHKSVNKGKKNLLKLVIGCAVIVSICKLSDVYNDTKEELALEQNVKITNAYSPSGGHNDIYSENISSSEVFERMADNMGGRSR